MATQPYATPQLRRALDPSVVPRHVTAALRKLASDGRPVSVYAYDTDVARDRSRQLSDVLPPWVEIFYAVKANAFPPVLRKLAPWVDGFEVSSAREADLSVRAATGARRRARLVATGPGKTLPTLARLLDREVEVINVESLLELRRVVQLAETSGRSVGVALRVNPAPVNLGNDLKLGGSQTAFGIPEAAIPTAAEIVSRSSHVDLAGFHIHALTNNLDVGKHLTYVRWCLDWSLDMAARLRLDLQVIDCGGGFGVPFQEEPPLDIGALAAGLRDVRPPDGVRLLFEPGRWLVADCGYYAAEVTDVKHAYGTSFAVLRGGINHFRLPTTWENVHNFAVLPIEPWREPGPRPVLRDCPVTIVGELCTPEDTLTQGIVVGEVRPGDLIVFPKAGAYGWELSIQQFILHPPPQRLVVTNRTRTH